MEPRFGVDFSQVRVHTDPRATESAQAVNALAYTVGRNVVFGTGQYAPGTSEGRRLLAHELVHTIQQNKSSNGMVPQTIRISDADDAYERFAESVTRQIMEISPIEQTKDDPHKSRNNETIAGSIVANDLLLQRTCAQNSSEAFYQTASNYCKDTGFTGLLHSGDRCYREVPRRSRPYDCPPGDQVCFNAYGCYDSWDQVSPVGGKDPADGTCKLHGSCSIGHAAKDVLPDIGKGPGKAHREIRLSLPLIDPTTGKSEPGFEAQYRHFTPALLGNRLQPFVGGTLGTEGLGIEAGLTLEQLAGMGLYLEGRGALRTEWFQRVEVGGGAEVGFALNKSHAIRLGISWDAWQSLSEDKKREIVGLKLGFRF